MSVEQERTNQKLKSFIAFILGIVLQVIVFCFTNYFSSILSPKPTEVIVLSIVLIVFGLICWFSISLVVYMLKVSKEQLTDEEMFDIVKDYGQGKISICNYRPAICCLSRVFDTPGFGINISQEEKEANRLYTPFEISEIEKSTTNHSWQNIWIFSENLSTEIDINGNIEAIPQININNGVKYIEFYLDNKNETEILETRKQAMLNSINGSAKNNLKFFPLNTEKGYIGKNTLPLLCGSIMLSSYNEPNSDMPSFSEGYLSMRKSLEDDPIYYKMPRCMLNEYANYFKEKIKTKQQEELL